MGTLAYSRASEIVNSGRNNWEIISRLRIELIIITIMVIGAGLGLSLVLTNSISKPLEELFKGMEEVGSGKLNVKLPFSSLDEIAYLTYGFNKMVDGLREKEKIKNTFNKFISEEVVKEVLENEEALKLGGDYKEVTMLFADIRSFTVLSEKLPPHKVVQLLNEYLSEMTDIIIKNKGIIDKYVGDEIMAIFGAPIKHNNDPELAVRTAVEMLKRVEELNEKRRKEGKQAVRIGIGINTGRVIAGNIGSVKRMDYTVIGSSVNIAERICGIAGKEGRYYLLISESTYRYVKDIIKTREIEPTKVKGKSEFIKLYEVYSLKV